MPGSNHRFSVNLDWLIKLRWVAVAGQLITITGAVVGVGIPITLWPLAVVIGLTVISNFLLMFWFARVTTSHYNEATWNLILGLVMTMDMLSLTTLLFTTGGPWEKPMPIIASPALIEWSLMIFAIPSAKVCLE